MCFPYRLSREVSHLLIRLRGYSIRRHSIESSIFVQRNHGIICGCVRQTGKRGTFGVSGEKIAAGSHRAPPGWEGLYQRVSGCSPHDYDHLPASSVEKCGPRVRTVVLMKHDMVVRTAGTEPANRFRLIVFPTDQNTTGVWLQLDAVRQVPQSPSNLPHESQFPWSRRRMRLEHGCK
jgi:hypothetical protein